MCKMMVVYRFVGEEELGRLKFFLDRDKRVRDKTEKETSVILEGQMSGLVVQYSESANDLHDHTMTARGGGQIGPAGGQIVSMAKDPRRLAGSTDTVVQKIVNNAPYLVAFKVPAGAVMDAPSPLSKAETEVVLPNLAWALAKLMFKIDKNPYKK